MKRFVLLSLVILSWNCHAAEAPAESVDFHLFVDAWSIDSLWTGHTLARIGLGCTMAPGIDVELPVACLFDRTGGDEILLDLALKLVHHPWETGPFIALSLAQVCWFVGSHCPGEPVHYLNEIAFGYTWNFRPDLFVEPSVIYRDPSDAYPESFAYVNGLVPGYGKFRFCLEVGWKFASIAPPVS